jgi:hypothetical protein
MLRQVAIMGRLGGQSAAAPAAEAAAGDDEWESEDEHKRSSVERGSFDDHTVHYINHAVSVAYGMLLAGSVIDEDVGGGLLFGTLSTKSKVMDYVYSLTTCNLQLNAPDVVQLLTHADKKEAAKAEQQVRSRVRKGFAQVVELQKHILSGEGIPGARIGHAYVLDVGSMAHRVATAVEARAGDASANAASE